MKEICAASHRSVEVILLPSSTDRLVAASSIEKRCLSMKLRIRATVVSDYLFVGSGHVKYLGLERVAQSIAQRLRHRLSLEQVDVRGMEAVKEFFRIGEKLAIPGSTLKGAVRSRIELASSGDKVVAAFLYDTGPLQELPQPGQHGWRHARIWCESVFENRQRRGFGYTPLEDLLGCIGEVEALGSRVFFGTLIGIDVSTEVLVLDHGEKVEAAKRGSRFEGEIVALGVTIEELGLLFYGLAQDKVLCGKEPLMLIGASKYRCRTVERPYRRRVEFGVVRIDVLEVVPAPWSRASFYDVFGSEDTQTVVMKALHEAFAKYPGLRKCFDEVERKRCVEPC